MTSFISLLAILTTTISLVLAGPGGYVTLINATPYDWKLVYQHSYQMDWHPRDLIPAGTSFTLYFEYWYHHHDVGDDAAEALYAIVGAPTQQHFTLKAVQDGEKNYGKKIKIQFQDELESIGNPHNSEINLGFTHDGVVAFALAGNGDSPYMSTNSQSENWMQITYDTISGKTLREVSLPASHNSGMSELTFKWSGIAHNTQTQAVHIYTQLKLGIRFFDIRPMHYYDHFFTGHFSTFGWDGRHIGATGRTMENIVNDINTFCDENPGELIILDVSHDMDIDDWWYPLKNTRWEELYKMFADIKDLWVPNEKDRQGDITRLPLSSFIQKGGRCSVVIRIENDVVQPGETLTDTSHGKRAVRSQGIAVEDRGGRERPVDGEPGGEPSSDDPEEIPPLDTVNGFGNYPEDQWRAAVEAILASHILNGTSTSKTKTSTEKKVDPDTTSAPFPPVPNLISRDDWDCWTDSECNNKIPLIPDPKDSPQRSDPDPSNTAKLDLGPISHAVIRAARFPITGSYSDTRHADLMVTKQFRMLAQEPAPHMAYFTLTQYWTDVVDVLVEKHSIIYMARWAHKGLFDQLWPAMVRSKGASLPNMVLIDAVRDNQLTGLVTAMNAYFPRANSQVKDLVLVDETPGIKTLKARTSGGLFIAAMGLLAVTSTTPESLGHRIAQAPTGFVVGGVGLLATYFIRWM